MATLIRSLPGPATDRVFALLRSRSARNAATLVLVLAGPVLATLTVIALGERNMESATGLLRAVILADLLYVLVIATLVAARIARMIAERRRHSAGSRLHGRLMLVFTVVALAPAVLVAIFATLTINFGIETWFSDRVRSVLRSSLAAAQAYETEHRENIRADAKLLAGFLDANKARFPLLAPADLRELLTRGQAQMQREILEAFVIDGAGTLVVRGAESYLFDYEPPTAAEIAAAQAGEAVVIEDWAQSEFRALLALDAFADRLLYVTRRVDGKILTLLDETKETVGFYNQLETERGQLLLEFALIYIGFALLVIISAIWLGLWFADRLAGPVGRLAGAAQRIGAGDLEVRVEEDRGDDEIAMLSRTFNRMAERVKGQRDALMTANAETERRRRLFAAVLSGVTAGVIGLDRDGRIEVANAAAERLLGTALPAGAELGTAAPALAPLLDRLRTERRGALQDEIHLAVDGTGRDLLVRVAARAAGGASEGSVVTFDDITDLVAAQRMAAWGDVARRIAHEIKNPLTPIQLSAERMKRKFAPEIASDRPAFEQLADVIVRQTGDLRRIVDEFSRFARMPAPDRRPADLVPILRDAVLLQSAARPDIRFETEVPEGAVRLDLDQTLIAQMLTNVLKNATEAIDARREKEGPASGAGHILVRLAAEGDGVRLTIRDDGTGLPKAQRQRLFEPYVTTREKGTGLGLPIVRKIIEDHGGRIELADAPPEPGTGHQGAEARIDLPLPAAAAPAPREPAESRP